MVLAVIHELPEKKPFVSLIKFVFLFAHVTEVIVLPWHTAARWTPACGCIDHGNTARQGPAFRVKLMGCM